VQTLAIVVTTPPHSNLTFTAIDFIEAAIASNIKVIGVFFYQDGVLNASKHIALPSDEINVTQCWQQLSEAKNIPLHLCISAAEKRGLSDETEFGSNILPFFTVSGLGELVELTTLADRVVQL
jgi:tRNA 2-thiouridine synthesizing protein D